jgi:carbon storage regulator
MLVLTRKKRQSVMIGDEIEVSILAVAGDKVRLGITAPRSVPVYRTEVYVQMRGGGGEEVEVDPAEVDRALGELGSGGSSTARD